jgi:hypothetical protein
MDVYIYILSAGADQGVLFDLYSDTDGFTTAFDTDIPLASLTGGYTSNTAPAGTTVVRVCGQQAVCPVCLDITPTYTTTTSTSLPPVVCNEITNSGGVGVTEYSIPLETAGGLLVIDFNAYGIPDKLEILHNGIKVATTGMTTPNEGPFDDLYGDPTVPDNAQALAVDQFIGTQKSVPPTRETEIFNETGKTYIVSGQQLVWFEYTLNDVFDDSNAIVRITGPSGTAWQLQRLCDENTTTTTTTSSSSTTTTTTTVLATTTTTTTSLSIVQAGMSSTTDLIDACGEALNNVVYIDQQSPTNVSVGDIIYNDPGATSEFNGNGDYYAIEDANQALLLSARVNAFGVILSPISICGPVP